MLTLNKQYISLFYLMLIIFKIQILNLCFKIQYFHSKGDAKTYQVKAIFSVRIFKPMVTECRHELLNFFRSQIWSHLNNSITFHDSNSNFHSITSFIFAFSRVVKTCSIIHTLSRVVLHCLRPRCDVVYPFTTFPLPLPFPPSHAPSHMYTYALSQTHSHANTHPLTYTYTHNYILSHTHTFSRRHCILRVKMRLRKISPIFPECNIFSQCRLFPPFPSLDSSVACTQLNSNAQFNNIFVT
jgi:hypothetical protein